MSMYVRTKTRYARRPRPGPGLYIDPLYGRVPIPLHIRKVIDLPIFQRLGEIKQLSTIYLKYRCALHTRFDHSVGVYHLASFAHDILKQKLTEFSQSNAPKLNKVTRTALELGALLHDIGHGPFGHVFEHLARRLPKRSDWTHEKLTRDIICGKKGGTELLNTLEEIRGSLEGQAEPPELLDILKPENIYNIGAEERLKLPNQLSKQYHFLTQVVPFAFGVDRLDYLRRDAYFSGIATGNIDIWEILHGMTVAPQSNGYWLLRLDSSAATAAEALLVIRDLTYQRLYYDPLHRGAQELLIRGLLDLPQMLGELALATDIDIIFLLQEAGQAKGFCRHVHERLRDRALYETVQLLSHAELRNLGAPALDYETIPFEKQQLIEREIAKEINLHPEDGRVIFDRELVPAIKIEDYKETWFIDPVKGEVSLFDLRPHLRTIYGEENRRKRHEYYNQSLSMVYVSLPYEHIQELIEAASSSGVKDPASIASAVYKKIFEPIARNFISELVGLRKAGDIESAVDLIKSRVVPHIAQLVRASWVK